MLDFNKLGDMAKLAGEAKKIQEKQERMQNEQLQLLQKISNQMDEVIHFLKDRK